MREFTRVNRFAMAMLVVMIVGSGIVSTITAWLQIEGILTRYILTYTLQFAFPLCVYFFLYRDHSPKQVLRLKKTKGYTYVLTVIFAFAIQPLLMCLSSLSTMIFHNYLNDSIQGYLKEPWWAVLLATTLIPAVMEELVCRGVYLSGCRRWNIYGAAALNGVFFGVLHLNPQQAVYAAIFGFSCALITLGADSLWPAMLAHFIINGTQILMAFGAQALAGQDSLLGWLLAEMQKEESLWKVLPVSILLAGIAVWCLIRIYYVNRRQELLRGKRVEGWTMKEAPLKASERFEGLCWLGGIVLIFITLSCMVGMA